MSDVPLKIDAVSSLQDFITVNLLDLKLPKTLKPKEKMSFQVSLDASLMKEKTWGQVVVSTDNAHTPKVNLYITGRTQQKAQPVEEGKLSAEALSLPEIKFSEQAKKLFPKYNFVLNNIVKNLAECNLGQCLPMKAYIQLLINQNMLEAEITKAVQSIYGPKSVSPIVPSSTK